MDNLGDIKERLQRRLVVADSSTLYTDAILTDLVADAYDIATTTFPWKDLTVVFETSTQAGVYYYDYPTAETGPAPFVTDSISFLTINHGSGDKEYDKKDFQDFVRWKRENPNDQTRRIFAENERKWYVHPVPQVTGTWNVTLHAQKQATALVNNSDTTIFSESSKDGNKAILRLALSDALARIDPKLSRKEEEDGLGILTRIFKREKDNQQLNQRLDHPRFEVQDMFRQTGGYTPTGDFSYSKIG